MEKSCLFCLESVKESDQIPNVVGCDCELVCHASCMQNWFETKHQLECPVCHAVSVPNMAFHRDGEHIITVVHVTQRQRDEELRAYRMNEKCIGFCCLSLILWGVAANLISYFL